MGMHGKRPTVWRSPIIIPAGQKPVRMFIPLYLHNLHLVKRVVNEVTDLYERLPERFNASEYFIRTLNTEAGRANHPALFYKDEKYTYGEMERQINKYGNAIVNKG